MSKRKRKGAKAPRRVDHRPHVALLTCQWQRHTLTRFVFDWYRHVAGRVDDVMRLTMLSVGSEGEASRAIAEAAGFQYVEHPNEPLGAKWNAGLKALQREQPDAVLIVGSDDLLDEALLRAYANALNEGARLVGLLDMYFFDHPTGRMLFWPGYKGEREGETTGLGRCIHRAYLEQARWKLWEDEREKGLDRSMMRVLQPIVDAGDAEKHFFFRCRKGGFAPLDVKTAENMWDFNTTAGSPGAIQMEGEAVLRAQYPGSWVDRLLALDVALPEDSKIQLRGHRPEGPPRVCLLVTLEGPFASLLETRYRTMQRALAGEVDVFLFAFGAESAPDGFEAIADMKAARARARALAFDGMVRIPAGLLLADEAVRRSLAAVMEGRLTAGLRQVVMTHLASGSFHLYRPYSGFRAAGPLQWGSTSSNLLTVRSVSPEAMQPIDPDGPLGLLLGMPDDAEIRGDLELVLDPSFIQRVLSADEVEPVVTAIEAHGAGEPPPAIPMFGPDTPAVALTGNYREMLDLPPDDGRLRVLLGTQEIGNQITLFAQQMRAMGVHARSVNYHDSYLGYGCDYVYSRQDAPNMGVAFHDTARLALEFMQNFDVFHFVANSTLCFDLSDLPLLKHLGARLVMHHVGSDVRLLSVARRIAPYTVVKNTNESQITQIMQLVSTFIREGIVNEPTLYEYTKMHYEKVHLVPVGMDLQRYAPPAEPVENERPLVVHAPTNRAVKGSDYIIAALENLKKKYDFDFQLIEGMPHEEARRIYEKADVIVDQVRLGMYGGFAIESMAMGKPVIVHLCDYARAACPEDVPVIDVTPETVERGLEMAINEPGMRAELGRAARRYVERYHDVRKVSRSLLKIYQGIGVTDAPFQAWW